MHGTADLDRLAELVGIESFYWDIWGNRRETSADTKRGLIAAMGLDAGSDAAAAASLRLVEERTWRRLLPPVLVVDEGQPPQVALSLPAGHTQGTVRWRLEEEGGAAHDGAADLAALEAGEEGRLDGEAFRRRLLPLPVAPPPGYHRLTVTANGTEAALSLVVAPERGYQPEEMMPAGQGWGLGVQLYSLRSDANWGVGDFGDLARLARVAAGQGASLIGLNPLHALFPADPHHFGPYSPSSRSFLNILYIDVPAVPDFVECAPAQAMVAESGFAERLAAARDAELIDYPAVNALKRPVLERLYQWFRAKHLGKRPTARGKAFQGFCEQGDEPLRRHALFDALHEHFFASGQWSWQEWPEPFRRPDSAEVAAFAEKHVERVGFFAYLQWLADSQLESAARAAREAGMAVGLYCDLAVANHPGGAAAWANPSVLVQGAGVGAPPDQFSPTGQNWGLAPLSPVALVETAYQPFINSLRANMRHAGAVRIDHAMALQHLFWIPDTGAPGAYVRYPLHDLLRIVALESRRNRCLVIGEDLGTVPEGFRPAMVAVGILSYRVLYFERGKDSAFLPPEAYPAEALVTATTHDLPTFRGFWFCRDLQWRDQLGLFPTPEVRQENWDGRHRDKQQLVQALIAAGLLGPDAPMWEGLPELSWELVAGVHRYLARTPGRILMIQIEDALGELEQPNLPGTTDQHPNWRRRTSVPVERLADAEGLRRLIDAVRAERGG
ncbi:MAG TPA: 4-alpha-glucanotransferase [Azospirillaceae bacterium]|nr:4-alpha-glucanotransferase [Azospirillaceae bacterium]